MVKVDGQKLTPKRTKTRLPRFKSIKEAAEFWDTHDSAEFEEEFETVEDVKFLVVRGRLKKAITVRLPEDTLASLTQQAQELGIGPSTLARVWILEHLRERTKPQGSKRS